MSSARIRVEALRLELARRGWNHSDLARSARISPATVTLALKRARVSASTLRKIARALTEQPVLDGADALLDSEGAA